MELEDAIEKTIKELDEEAFLKSFLVGHLTEVKGMCLREYSEEEIKEMFKNDGIEETRISDIKNIVERFGISYDDAMDILKIPEKERERLKIRL